MKHFSSLSVKQKFFISYTSIFIIPCVLFGIFGYFWMSHSVDSSYVDTYTNICKNLNNKLNDELKALETFALQSSQSSLVHKIMYMQGDEINHDRVDLFSLSDYCRQLETHSSINRFASFYAICFHDKNLVLSNTGQSTISNFFNYDFKINDMNAAQWNGFFMKADTAAMLYDVNLRTLNYVSTGMLYLRTLPFDNFSDKKATFIAFIPYQAFERLTEQFLPGEEIGASFFDDTDTDIYQINWSGNNLVQETYTKDNTLFVFSSRDSEQKWATSISVPRQLYDSGIVTINLLITFILIIMLGVGIYISKIMAQKSFAPIKDVLDLFPNEYGGTENELARLTQSVQHILDEEKQLVDALERQKPIITESYVRSLLLGHTLSEEISKVLKMLSLKMPYKNFVCLSLSKPDIDVKNKIEKILERYASQSFGAYLEQSFSMIINFSEQEIEKIIDEIKRIEGKINIGIGCVYRKKDDVSYSYRESIRALKHCKDNNGICVTEYNDIKDVSFNYYYPIRLENKLITCFSGGDFSTAEGLINELVRNNKESQTALQNLFYGLSFTLVRVCDNLSYNLIDMEKIMAMIATSFEDVHGYILDITRDLCDKVSESAKEQNYKKYIQSNLTDYNLSLITVADNFNMSPSAFSKVFKKTYDVNFATYVAERRVEEAKKLLADTDYDISVIAKQVGYDSDVTFRRVFKNVTGISASEFRKT